MKVLDNIEVIPPTDGRPGKVILTWGGTEIRPVYKRRGDVIVIQYSEVAICCGIEERTYADRNELREILWSLGFDDVGTFDRSGAHERRSGQRRGDEAV